MQNILSGGTLLPDSQNDQPKIELDKLG